MTHVPLVERYADDVFFSVDALHEAGEQARRDPANVTDHQLRMIASYTPDEAQIFARRRAEARATAAAPPAPVPAPVAAPPRAKSAKSEDDYKRWFDAVTQFITLDDNEADEQPYRDAIDRLCQCEAIGQLTVVLPLLQFLRASNTNNKKRNKSIKSLNESLEPLAPRLLALEVAQALDAERIKSIDTLEARLAHLEGHDARLETLERVEEGLKAYVAKQLAEAQPNDEFETRVRRLESLHVLAYNDIQNLKTTARPSPGSTWAGEYESGKSYAAGEVVRRKGTPWLCTRATDAAPGLAPDCWELFYK